MGTVSEQAGAGNVSEHRYMGLRFKLSDVSAQAPQGDLKIP